MLTGRERTARQRRRASRPVERVVGQAPVSQESQGEAEKHRDGGDKALAIALGDRTVMPASFSMGRIAR